MNSPNIHLFSTSEHFYFYDVNKNDIVMISEQAYEALDNELEDNILPEISTLKQQGYLKSDRVKYQENSVTPYLEAYLENKLNQVVLQVTQSCNLRCEYCVYSGAYQNRTHTQLQMSESTAKKAIDFLISHSSDTSTLMISFYGGEPLLRVDFLKMCVDYAKTQGEGKEIVFNLTTNGTLLDDSVVDFLAQNKVSVMISLDGPEPIHDYHRRFVKDSSGSFHVLQENVLRLKERHPEYFSTSVRFNTVLDQSREFSCVDNFISGAEWLKESFFNATTIASDYLTDKIETSPVFIAQREYEYFKLLLAKLHKIDEAYISKLVKPRWDNLMRKMHTLVFNTNAGVLPEKAHHGGPCIPGVLRLFVTADGQLFPCEKVSEKSSFSRIGDLDTGFDVDKARQIMNIGKANEEQCSRCWAFRYCDICVRAVDGLEHLSSRLQGEACKSSVFSNDQVLKDYCVMCDLGYNMQEESIL